MSCKEAIKHKQGLRSWGCRGCTGGAHVCNRYEFSSAFQRNKNFENRTTFGWVREILGILELRWNDKNSQKGDFWKIFGPICTFYYIKWPPSSRFPSSRSFPRSQNRELGRISVYSYNHNKRHLCLFMKQNCHFDRGLAQYKHATPPLSFSGIITTLLGFPKRYITLVYLKGLKSCQ